MSFGLYNGVSEIDRLFSALEQVRKFFILP